MRESSKKLRINDYTFHPQQVNPATKRPFDQLDAVNNSFLYSQKRMKLSPFEQQLETTKIPLSSELSPTKNSPCLDIIPVLQPPSQQLQSQQIVTLNRQLPTIWPESIENLSKAIILYASPQDIIFQSVQQHLQQNNQPHREEEDFMVV